jgi:DNA-binding transcriptional ArsR family regulator
MKQVRAIPDSVSVSFGDDGAAAAGDGSLASEASTDRVPGESTNDGKDTAMNTNDIARIARLVGEPARAAMLVELMGGRALTAGELARGARVSAPTASRHLALMVEGGLVVATARGRHRYHRLASREVAAIIEATMQLASLTGSHRPIVTGPKDEAMRRARTCYDHLAGRLGVAVVDHLVAAGALELDLDSARPMPALARELAALGPGLADGDSHCRPCMDWAERRPHLAGPLAVRLCNHLLGQGWLRRPPRGRALEITGTGARYLGNWLGARRWSQVDGEASY